MTVAERPGLSAAAARAEALGIFDWWANHAPDIVNGGFYGEVDEHGTPVLEADKGAVLNARLLWFFSAIAQRYDRSDALALARRAHDYMLSHFVDMRHGGVYWSVDYRGRVRDARKQAYAQAFCIYALAEYHLASRDHAALDLARWLQGKIERIFWDEAAGGYIEALDGDWRPIGDQRLSDKDLDAPKTMNTHLHVLEAYTRLHQVAPDPATGAALRRATLVFLDRFIGPKGGKDDHLRLFFDMDWTDRTVAVSFGHDIEASWLLQEAVEALGDPALIARARPHVLALARVTLAQGVLAHGGIAYERGFDGHLDPDGEWWGQAEGLVGFVNAFRMTGEAAYAEAAQNLWTRIRTAYGAAQGGEWTWYAQGAARPPQALASLWKCPYHNGRAMLELDQRLKNIKTTGGQA
jgi:mannobiose 2-epimerase